MAPAGTKVVASNRRARHEYAILDTVEAGLVLRGSEVKTLRMGMVQLADAYGHIVDGECWLESLHIPPYSMATGFGGHDPDRRRKLLLHAGEIEKLRARIATERLTLVPLSLYFKEGRAKVELGLAKGRTKGDKRQVMAERDAAMDIRKALGRQQKGVD